VSKRGFVGWYKEQNGCLKGQQQEASDGESEGALEAKHKRTSY